MSEAQSITIGDLPPPTLPRPRRPKAPPWSPGDKAKVKAQWSDPTVTIEEIAASVGREVQAVRQMACAKLKLGQRPREQSFGSATRGKPRPARAPTPAEVDAQGPCRLLPTVDGVVLTARLDAAWDRVQAGEAVGDVAADMRLPAIEVAALRRWMRDRG